MKPLWDLAMLERANHVLDMDSSSFIPSVEAVIPRLALLATLPELQLLALSKSSKMAKTHGNR